MDKCKEKPPATTNSGKPKEKRRSNEKRKEKSRDAARCRRSRETEIFTELAHVLPLRREDVEQLDKASIMRLSIAFLKVRETLKLFPNIENLPLTPTDIDTNQETERKPFDILNGCEAYKLMAQALDGFLMILSSEGDVTYVSENISEFLGISQIDILGQQIWEYSHQCDHDELKEALNMRKIVDIKKEEKIKDSNSSSIVRTAHRDFFLRLKCTLTSRGRSVNIKSASYKVIHVTGHMVMNNEGERILIAIGRPLPHPSNIEIPLESTTFLTKHSLDMKFTYVDDKMLSLLGYQPEDLLATSLYGCHHGADSESLMTTFKSVLSKGQAETCRYRFLGKCGGYSWVVTQATIVYDKQKPQSVVCVNYVISEIENNNEIYSCAQLEAYRQKKESILQQKDEDNHQQTEIKQSQHQHNQQNDDNTNNNDETDEILTKSIHRIKHNEQIKRENKKREDISLSPIRRTFNNCTISTIASATGSTTKVQDNRPKSVTASVFTQVPITDHILNHSTTTSSTNCSAVSRAQSVTASVFTPISALPNLVNQNRSHIPGNFKNFLSRTEDMNKGYLMFAEETPDLTMLKEESDDLTHLAPTAGDACIPLDESTPPLFGEMLENLILPDSYGTLLPDDINSLDSQQSNGNNKSHIDPFINYRDESSDISNSPHLLSPGAASKSPEMSSLPSLCSPNSLSQEDEFAFMTMTAEDDIDLTMRAPYIPMNEQEDLPLLTEDLMWSAISEELSLHKDIKESLQLESIKNNANIGNSFCSSNSNSSSSSNDGSASNESSLAALLCGNTIQQQDTTSTDTNDIKKRKIVQNDSDNAIVDSIDAFGSVFNKSSTNVDCWSMNDLLQINTTNTESISHQENRPEKQNLIVNTAIPSTTIHVPLIAIQNKNCSNKINCNGILNNNTVINNNNTTSSNNKKNGIKCLNMIPNNVTSKGLNNVNNNPIGTIITTACSKRPSNITLSPDTKRVKSSPVEIQTSPQLLQQLMAPAPQRQRSKGSFGKVQQARWDIDDGGGQQTTNFTSSSSNSVLKNLLVSGCDDTLSSQPPDILDDEASHESLKDSLYFTRPLHCKVNQAQIMRTCGTNPLIGGVGILPSPPMPLSPEEAGIPISGELMTEEYSPRIISPRDTESNGSDSGIECSNPIILNNLSKQPNVAKMDIDQVPVSNKVADKFYKNQNRKISLSFLDDVNPLSSPFLMELCNDDYNMAVPLSSDFLNQWTPDMT